MLRILFETFFSQLIGFTIYAWKWLSVQNAFEPWADTVGILLVSPAFLLPLLAALLVLFQFRSDLPSAIKPTQQWRKNALKQNKKDKYRGEERRFRYTLREGNLRREKNTNLVVSDA